MVAGRAPGSATFRSAPQSVRRVAPPDKVAPYRKWRAWVRGHARARPRGAPAKRAGAQLSSKARALYITALCTPASGDPGRQLRRGPAGRLAAHEGPGTRGAHRPDRQHCSRQSHAAPVASRSRDVEQGRDQTDGTAPDRLVQGPVLAPANHCQLVRMLELRANQSRPIHTRDSVRVLLSVAMQGYGPPEDRTTLGAASPRHDDRQSADRAAQQPYHRDTRKQIESAPRAWIDHPSPCCVLRLQVCEHARQHREQHSGLLIRRGDVLPDIRVEVRSESRGGSHIGHSRPSWILRHHCLTHLCCSGFPRGQDLSLQFGRQRGRRLCRLLRYLGLAHLSPTLAAPTGLCTGRSCTAARCHDTSSRS